MKKIFSLVLALMMLTCAMAAAESVMLPNPWNDITADQAADLYPFTLPEGADNVIYRSMDDMLELQFTLEGVALNYRIAVADEDEDISGMYYIWETETPVQVSYMQGLLCAAADEGEQVQLVTWYDTAPGLSYALSATGEDLSALDLTALAAVMYTQTQGEADSFSFEELAGLSFEFSSGVGAWHCTVNIDADGSFTGSYTDSDMGDAGEGYEYGTVYTSDFHGTLTLQGEGEEDCTWLLLVSELALDEGLEAGTEIIEDGVRYVVTEPAGFKLGNQMMLYTPGAAVSTLSEDAAFWFHLNDMELGAQDTLPVYGLYDAAEQTGFVAFLDE